MEGAISNNRILMNFIEAKHPANSTNMFCMSDTVMVNEKTFKHFHGPFVSLYSTTVINFLSIHGGSH